jgi:integrase/recombinase XerC
VHINDALREFETQLQADGRRPLTIEQYGRHIHLLARWLAERDASAQVEDIDHRLLAAFLSSKPATHGLDGREKSPMSINVLRSSLRVFFRYLHDAGLTEVNAARLIRRARCRPAPHQALSAADQRGLLLTMRAATEPAARRDHVIFNLMLGTGMRLGSALELEARDVDLERGEILLRQVKGQQPYLAIVPTGLRPELARLVRERPAGPLFPGRDGRPLSGRQVQRRLEEWMRRSGLTRQASPHTLRHTFATGLYLKTGDLPLVQRALGQRSIASASIYAHCDAERLRDAVGARNHHG